MEQPGSQVRSLGAIALVGLAVLLFSSTPASGEDFHVEFTAGYWPLSPSGSILTRVTRVDLRTDLGIEGRKSHPEFKVVFKPGSKHRINFELVPYRFEGTNTINRSFELGGRTYPVQDRITSEAGVDYLFGGYQYDPVNNDRGHFGIGAGVAYFAASAEVTSQTLGVTGIEERKLPLPLVGGEFRVFPVPASNIWNINGEAKGMSLGSYGRYFHASIHTGFAVAPVLRLQAGFNFIDADLHQRDRTQGFKVRFGGPIFSVQLHD
jgi:hypothetical protein